MDDFVKIVDVAAHVAGARMAGTVKTMEEVDDEIDRLSARAGLSSTKAGEVRYLVNSFLALGDGILYAQQHPEEEGVWKVHKRIS